MAMELDDSLRRQLIDLLADVPGLRERKSRDAWLVRNLPRNVQNLITPRDDHCKNDLTFIINVVQGLQLEDDRWAILILVDDLLNELQGVKFDDLRRVREEITDALEKSLVEPKEPSSEPSQSEPPPRGDPKRQDWLSRHGFRWDPFIYPSGEKDPHLQDYFYEVDPFWDIVDAERGPIIVFGLPGSGKSSLRSASLQYRYRNNDHILAVIYRDFGPLVSKCEEGKGVQVEDHVKQILKMALEALSTQTPTNPDKILQKHLWLYTDRYVDDLYVQEILRNRLKPDPEIVAVLPTDPCELLRRFCRDVTKLFGYQFVYIIVDPDPDDIAEDIAWQVLRPLLSERRLLEVRGTDDGGKEKVIAAFYFFLDQKFRHRVLEIPWLKAEQSTRVRELRWNEDRLLLLLQQRLIACSAERHEHLGELSDGVNDLDERVVQLSGGSPRELIAICDRLFSEHSRKWSPDNGEPLLITAQEVYEVLKPFEARCRESELEQLIAQGESEKLEFKSTMRYNLNANRPDKEMEREIARTICAFMNTEGGTLIIGVDDDGTILGLEKDFSTLGRRQNKDGLEQAFVNITENLFSSPLSPDDYTAHFEELQGRPVYVVRVKKSQKPVFCLLGGVREFYVRKQTTTRKLDSKETLDYYMTHFYGSE